MPIRRSPLDIARTQHKNSALDALRAIETSAKIAQGMIANDTPAILRILRIGRDYETALREAQAIVSFSHGAQLARAVRHAEEEARQEDEIAAGTDGAAA